MIVRRALALSAAALLALTLAACGQDSGEEEGEEPLSDDSLVVYSGRSEELVAPLFAQFTEETGIPWRPGSATVAELAAQLLEEGDATPARGVLLPGRRRARRGRGGGPAGTASRWRSLPRSRRPTSPPTERGRGVTGRARVIVYDPEQVAVDRGDPVDGPDRPGVAGAGGHRADQRLVPVVRDRHARRPRATTATKAWLEGLVANDVQTYEKNSLDRSTRSTPARRSSAW